MNSKKYTTWISMVYDLVKEQGRKLPDYFNIKEWYNAGYTPYDIIDNLDFILNASHP